jgi:hypothetical protein
MGRLPIGRKPTVRTSCEEASKGSGCKGWLLVIHKPTLFTHVASHEAAAHGHTDPPLHLALAFLKKFVIDHFEMTRFQDKN